MFGTPLAPLDTLTAQPLPVGNDFIHFHTSPEESSVIRGAHMHCTIRDYLSADLLHVVRQCGMVSVELIDAARESYRREARRHRRGDTDTSKSSTVPTRVRLRDD